jgi:hypothetical protein
VTAAVAAVSLLALLLGGSACSTGGSQRVSARPSATATVTVTAVPSPSATTQPSPPQAPPTASPQPAAGPATTNLTFTGTMAAQVRAATSAGPCGRAPAGFAAELHFSISAQPYVLSITLFDYGGPGRYTIPPGRVSVRSGQGAAGQLMPAIRGFLTVDARERSGRIDAAIGDGSTQVNGSWACS